MINQNNSELLEEISEKTDKEIQEKKENYRISIIMIMNFGVITLVKNQIISRNMF